MKIKYKCLLNLLPFSIMAIAIIFNLCFDLLIFSSFPAKRFIVKYYNNDVPIVGNIYIPKNRHEVKIPAIIYVSGFMSQKDIDPRIPVEFCRRGFLVVTIDIHGHGEMDGYFGNLIITDVENAMEYVKSNLNTIVDVNRIGIVGHSAGGYAVLGAEMSSVAAKVVWATPSYYDEKIIYKTQKTLKLYNPSATTHHLKEMNKGAPYFSLNKTNSKNLLLIHHEKDPVVSIKQAEAIQRKTDSPLLIISKENRTGIFNLFDIPLLNHYLIHDSVMINTINWFESKLNLNREKIDNNYNFFYLYKFYFIIIFFAGSFWSIFTIINIFSKNNSNCEAKAANIMNSTDKTKNNYLFLFSPVILFGSLYASHMHVNAEEKIMLNEYFIIPSAIILPFIFLYFFQNKSKIRTILTYKNIWKSLFICTYFLIINFLFAWYFKFFVLYPHKISNFIFSILIVLPWFILSGLIFFHLSGNHLYEFIASKTKLNPDSISFIKTLTPAFLGIIYYLIFLSMMPKVSLIIIVIIIIIILHIYSSYMYYRRYSILEISIFNTIISSFFYGTCYWFF